MKTLGVSTFISTRTEEKKKAKKKVNFNWEANHTTFWISPLLQDNKVLQSFANSVFLSDQN